jgi:HAD superfamily hydrolase (TIGR01549 family)
MAIEAVFFDWMETVGHPEVERHDLHAQVFSRFGIEVAPLSLIRPIYKAETEVSGGTPYRWDESKDPERFISYEAKILSEIGINLPWETILQIMKELSRDSRLIGFCLYDDVIPTVEILKGKGLILGLITSMKNEIVIMCRRLGLAPYLDFIVTSSDVEAPKPEPPVFLKALERSGVDASSAMYVGDQYSTDVVGARSVGINPVLIDRYGVFNEVDDCPRVSRLDAILDIF